MNNKIEIALLLLLHISTFTSLSKSTSPSQIIFKNTWTKPTVRIPNKVSIDAPLIGNGDLTMSVGFSGDGFQYYLCY